MKLKRAFVWFGLITGLYLVGLIWVDAKSQIFAGLLNVLHAVPVLVVISLLSIAVRYARWHWLLNRAGERTRVFSGFLAYLSGFAFTATPGKVGELLRIRYLGRQGVPHWKVFAAFVYERAFDLMAVLLLASLAISRIEIFVLAVVFVGLFLGGIVLVAVNPSWLTKLSAILRLFRFHRSSRFIKSLRLGLSGCRVWLTPLDAFTSLGLGMVAWALVSLAFLYLLSYLHISDLTFAAIAIYPLAMLAGAASMLPGGLGSTEATIVALLAATDVPIDVAALAAVGIRFSTMWFSVLCGFLALGVLEIRDGVPRTIR